MEVDKLWEFALRSIEQMGNDVKFTASVKLPTSDSMCVELPKDYINFQKVGILKPDGRIAPFISNKKK